MTVARLAATALAAGGLTAAVAPARASAVTPGPGRVDAYRNFRVGLLYTARAHERNRVRVAMGDRIEVSDLGATITAGHLCRQITPHRVSCGTPPGAWPPAIDPIRISTGDGNDVIHAFGEGNTYIDAGPGRDTVVTAGMEDDVTGGPGHDVLREYGDWGILDYADHHRPVRITVGRGPDGSQGERDSTRGFSAVIGGSGDDVLIGNQRDNDLAGGPGRDRLEGGGGNDQLDGGPGRDVEMCGGTPTDGNGGVIPRGDDFVAATCEGVNFPFRGAFIGLEAHPTLHRSWASFDAECVVDDGFRPCGPGRLVVRDGHRRLLGHARVPRHTDPIRVRVPLDDLGRAEVSRPGGVQMLVRFNGRGMPNLRWRIKVRLS